MPTNQKVLGQLAPAAATLSAAYTVPALTQAAVSTITVCNTSGTPDSFNISVAIAGAGDTPAQYLYSGISLPGNNTFAATMGITLGAADVVRVYSLNGTSVFNLFGCETT